MSRALRCLALLMLMVPFGVATRAEEMLSLPTRPGVTQPILFTTVAHPAASVILFPGGAGRLRAVTNNFLVRTAPAFAALDLNVAIADTPLDQPQGMSDAFRVSPAHAEDIAAVIAFLHGRAAVPIWLVGTSRGTISAASVAIQVGPPRLAGVVLTSTVWLAAFPQLPLEQLRLPTLIVHNRNDGCSVSPFSMAAPGLQRFSSAPVKDLMVVSGGNSRSAPCDALSPHGYYGIEDQVVPPIAAWIKAH